MLSQYLFASVLIAALTAHASPKDLTAASTRNFLISTAPAGCMPKGMKVDFSDSNLYVAEMCGKIDPSTKKRVPTASIYDMKTRALKKTLITPVGMSKDGILANTEVEFSVDGRYAFISRAEGDSNSEIFKHHGLLTVVNTQTQNIVKYIPTKGDGSKIITARPPLPTRDPQQILYVANYFSDDISIIDVTKLSDDGNLDGSQHYVKMLPLHSAFRNPQPKSYLIAPRGIAFTPDGKYALILATETGSIIIVDSINHKQLGELPPMPKEVAGRLVNVRHIVISKDGQTAYLSHMHGNAISRININKLIQAVSTLPQQGPTALLPAQVWNNILIPFDTKEGRKNILALEKYPADHPNFPNKTWSLAHPNTIALDPINNRYLYVSFRTTSTEGDVSVDPKIKGKIDIIDTKLGTTVFSLVGGAQPTALEISKNRTLISSGFIDSKLYFFDAKKIIDLYEKP